MFKTNYVSEIDQFLQVLNNQPDAFFDSRIAEAEKYQRIFELRDTPQQQATIEVSWIDK